MAITASRTSLGRDLEVGRESAASRGISSLMRKGLRQAKKEKDYDKALRFAAGLEGEGKAYGMTGSADDTSSIAMGRVNSRDTLATQMRGQMPALTGQTREGRIAAAKSAGTFDATREKFNKENSGKKTMDEAGNIMDAPATPPPATTPPASTTPPPAKVTARVSLTDQLINGASKPQAKVPMRPPESGGTPPPPSPAASEPPAKRKSVIMDNGVDVSEDIRKGLAGDRTGAFYTGKKPDAAPSTPTPTPAAADTPPAEASATADVNATPKRAADKNKTPSPTFDQLTKATPPATREVDPLLTDKRGFGNPDKTNPANWDYKPNPAASELPYIAGRGSDIGSRLLQVLNPFTMVQTLKQGGKSALPPMMGEQPEYANAYDRLKGDADAIKAAEAAGQIKARRTEDKYGNSKLEVLTPTMRETGERVPLGPKKPIPARAKGGPVKAGKPYLVGEEGPEIVVPDEDGEVLPNDKLRKKSRKELQKMLSKR